METETLTDLREQHEAERLRMEIAQLKHTSRLVESIDNYVYPHEQFVDDYGRPTIPAGMLTDRHEGRNAPIFRTEQELQRIRGNARIIADANGYGVGALNNLTNYVINTGFAYKVAAKDDAGEVPTETVTAVQRVVTEFIEENDWPSWEREFFRRSRRDGEFFMGFSHIGAGHTQVRAVEPEQATEVGNLISDDVDGEPTSWSFGVHTPERDVMEVFGYSVVWDAASQPDYIEADRIIHHKVNVDRNIKRGLTDFFPVTTDLDSARKLMRNTRDGAAIQAAIAFVKRFPQGTRRDFVQNEIQATTDWVNEKVSKTQSRRRENVREYPTGSVLSVSGDTEYLDTDDIKPASSQSDQGTETLNQELFVPRFAGIAGEAKLATDAAGTLKVLTDVIAEFDCPSSTWEVGDLVTVDENSGGTALLDAQLVKTTDEGLAIGHCVKREATAKTRVQVRLKSRVFDHLSGSPIAGIGSNKALFAPLAAQQALTDAGAVNVTTFYTSLTTTTASAVTLADGRVVGQLKKIKMIADLGNATLTPSNLSGGTTITFADVGDYVLLAWDGSNWVALELGNDADGATAPALA